MKHLLTSHRLPLLDDIDQELPMLAIAALFVIGTALAVYLYAAL